MKEMLFVFVLVTEMLQAKAQSEFNKVDSLKLSLKYSKIDSIKVKNQLEIGNEFFNSNRDTSIFYYKKALGLAQKGNLNKLTISALKKLNKIYFDKCLYKEALDYEYQLFSIYSETNNTKLLLGLNRYIAYLHFLIGDYDKAIEYANNALKINSFSDSIFEKININTIFGLSYFRLGNFPKAIKHYLNVIELAKKSNDLAALASGYNSIGTVYWELLDYKNSIKYLNESYLIAEKENNKGVLVWVCNNLGASYVGLKDYESANKYYQKGLRIALETNNSKDIADYYQCLSDLNLKQKYFDEAFKYGQIALENYLKIQHTEGIALGFLNTAEIFLGQLKYKDAIDYSLKSFKYIDKTQSFMLYKNGYQLLSTAYDSLGNPKEALKYYKLYTQAKDSILNIEKSKQIKQMEARYQAGQKQQQIELQQTQLTNKDLQLRRQRLTIALIASVFTLFSLIGGVTIYLFRRKRKQEVIIVQKNEELSKEKYQNLFKESQMQAIKEKILGQEEERTRIARELHDGIGGTLAAVKMRLEETTLQPNPEDMVSLVTLVANTWEEVRTISHNLMPPQFTEVSVDQVLQNHIKELSKSGKINFTIQFLPQMGWDKVPVELQVEIYRIVQELCSNIIKYSKATTVEIQLSQFDDTISLTMEDNGVPFSYSGDGIGYRNLQDRLKLLNGSFEKNNGSIGGNTYLIQIPVNIMVQNH